MRLKLAALVFVYFLFPRTANSQGTFQTIEDNYKWNLYYASFTSVTSKTVDPFGFGSWGQSTSTANGEFIGFDYTVISSGSPANLQIQVTTKTYSINTNGANPSGFNNSAPFGTFATSPSTMTSSVMTIPATFLGGNTALLPNGFTGKFQGMAKNPVFIFTALNANATYYLWVNYGQRFGP